MPFTIAHAVAARPLWWMTGRRLVLSAVVVGTMSPDFEYLVHLSTRRTIGHTIPGVFLACLPASLAVLFVWHRLVGPAVARLLPPGAGALGASGAQAALFFPLRRFAAVCGSVVAGALSHIAWDAFTHENGAVVRHWGALAFRAGPGDLPVYKWLQFVSGLFGMVLLGWWAARAAQRPVPAGAPPPAPPAMRRFCWIAVVTGAALVAGLGALRGVIGGDAYDGLKSAVVGGMAGGTLALLAVCAAVEPRLSAAPPRG